MFNRKHQYAVLAHLTLAGIAVHGGILPGHDERRTSVQESGAQCTLQIAEQHFGFGTTTAIVQSGRPSNVHFNGVLSSYTMMLSTFMASLSWTVVVDQANTYNGRKSSPYRINNYIWMLRTEEDVQSMLSMLIQTDSWNPHAKFFLYIDADLGLIWSAMLRTIFSRLWQEYVLQVVVMYPDADNYLYKMVTWFPYDDDNRGVPNEMLTIAMCTNKTISPVKVNFFPEKIPSNLDGYPVRVATALWEPFIGYRRNFSHDSDIVELDVRDGIETKIIRMVAAKLNLTLQFRVNLNTRSLEIDGKTIKTDGIFKDMFLRNADLAVCTIRPAVQLHSVFDHTVQYMQDELHWFVPRSQPKGQWKGLIDIFTTNLWILSFVMFLLILLIVYAIGRLRFANTTNPTKPTEPIQRIDEIAMQLGCMMFAASMSFKNRNKRQRIFIFLWAMLCLNYTTAYTSGFFSVLTTTRIEEEINSVDDILTSNLEIGISKPSLVFFMGTDELDQQVFQRNKGCPSTADCVRRVATDSNFAIASSKMYVKQLLADQFDAGGGEFPVRMLPVSIASPPIEMILIKGHPLLAKINECLLQMVESGLVDRWKFESRPIQRKVAKDWHPLTAFQMMGPFLVLILGMVVSALALMAEYQLYYLRKLKMPKIKMRSIKKKEYFN